MENTSAVTTGSTKYDFTPKRQFLYAIGDFGYNFVWTLVSSFLLYFWTDSFGISAGWAGTIILVSRIWDAINDPIVGRWADNTNTKWGKYRPWIMWSALPLVAVNILCFTVVPIESQLGKNIWACFIFMVAVLISTMWYVPYTAMLSALTLDPDKRAGGSSKRLMCAFAAALLITRFTLPLVDYFGQGNSARGYLLTALLYSCIGLVCWSITFLNTKEIVQIKVDKISYKESIKLLARNKYVWVLAMGFFAYGMMNYGRSGSAVYFFRYVGGNSAMYGTYGIVHFSSAFVGAFLMPKFAKRAQNKGSVVKYAYLVVAAMMVIQFFLVPDTQTKFIIFLCVQVVASIGMGAASSMLYGLMPDVVDYTQYIHSARAGGFISAFVNFCLKLGMALTVSAVGWILAATGYVAGAEQSSTTVMGIRLLFTLIPAVFALIASIIFFFYKLDKPALGKMVKEMGLKEVTE